MNINEKNKISVIIPVLNAEKYIKSLLDMLFNQTVRPDEIVVVDSESEDNTTAICKQYPNVRIISILRKDFDHGKTRDLALKQCIGDIVIFMTQDAIPYDNNCFENLVKVLKCNSKVAVACARQLPRKDASAIERLIREYNYPGQSNIRSQKDVVSMGIKAFFCSDVCAAYNKKIYEEIGGFDYPIKTNEDMLFAAKAINNDYLVAYCAEAMVYHSHNFNLREQYKRNYIQGFELQIHKEELLNVSQNSEGIKLVYYVSKKLLSRCKIVSFICFGFDCFARLLGNKRGRAAAVRTISKK